MRAVLAAALLIPFAGCAARDTVAIAGDGSGDDDLGEYCAGSGPPILVDWGSPSANTCAGDIAEDTFRYAICACGAVALNAALASDGFDSRIAPYAAGGLGGAVASNAGLDASRGLTIGGDLVIGSADGVEAGDFLHVAGDLDIAGGLGRPASAIEVSGSARIASTINVASLTVDGNLTTPPGTSITAPTLTVGSQSSAAVSVPLPCACDGADQVDIAAIVAAHKIRNHDAEIALDPAVLSNVAGTAELELPCGRFYLERIHGSAQGTVTIRATGRTALFVGAGIDLQQDLIIELSNNAELDIFVDGPITVAGYQHYGDPDHASRLRIYLSMSGAINMSAGSQIAGNLYAPHADLTLSAPLEIYGSLVIGRLTGAGEVSVHYDRAVAVAGDDCIE